MTEQEFQQTFRLALTRAKLPLRVWRQPAGRIRTDRDTSVECAPVGAADLTGVITDGAQRGRRVEIEMKGARTVITAHQLAWESFCLASGVLYLRIRYDADLSLDENLARAVAAVREAIG